MDECTTIKNLSETDIWNFFEGNLEESRADAIRKHVIVCRDCLNLFAVASAKNNHNDASRYNAFHQEIMAVRRAELMRFYKKINRDLDISLVKTPYDYFKYAIAGMLPADYGFLEIWDTLASDEKDEVVLKALKTIHGLDKEE